MVRPKNYDADGYIHFIEKLKQSTDIDKDGNKKHAPEKEMYEISFEEIEKMNLNKVGNEISYSITNVINMERYMMYYWKHIMDSDCILLYYHLWEYCDQRDGVDICYPKMNELAARMGMSKPTLITKIKKLEENNFLVQIHRLNKRRANKEDSPIFKLRQTIPLLTKQQYYMLPPLMQKKHDEYMEKFANDTKMEWFAHTSDETIDYLIDNYGDKIITSKKREEAKKALQSIEAEEYILTNLPENMKSNLLTASQVLNLLVTSKQFSKPTADFYFKETMTLYDEKELAVYIIAKDKAQKDFIKEVIIDKEFEKLHRCFETVYESIYHFKCFTREQFILKVLKG